MAVRTTRKADEDIIAAYLHGAAEYGIEQAERYHAGLMATFALLAANPRLARERSEFDPPMRLHPYQAHLIAYLVRDADILVVRVLHGRQAWERHL